jgi:hypothetical protein
MEHNVGTVDKVVRIVIGLVLIVVAYLYTAGIAMYVLYILGIIALVTAFTGFCGLYTLMGWNTTCEVKKASAKKVPAKKKKKR